MKGPVKAILFAAGVLVAVASTMVVAPAGAQQGQGNQLMTERERSGHQERLRSARSERERERIRAEYQKRMHEREKLREMSRRDGKSRQHMGTGRRLGDDMMPRRGRGGGGRR